MTSAKMPGKDYGKQLNNNNMSNQKQEKVYLPATFGNLTTFDDGGWIANVDFTDLKAFSDFVKSNKTDDGKFRIQITQQRNDPSKLSVSLNTYQPKAKQEEAEADIF